MIQSLSYTEMNHAVPGSSFSPRMDRYLECEVPSPSQWSDHCRSPPSLHSPTHSSADLEKIKEEPFSPLPTSHTLLLQPHRPMSREGLETSINLAELLEENTTLVTQVRRQQQQQQQQQQRQQPQQQQEQASSLKINDPLGSAFLVLDSFVDKEPEEESSGSSLLVSSSTSPAVSTVSQQPTSASLGSPQGTVRDCLRTVELMALDHCWQDVQRVSYKLNIPKDPSAWSIANVRSWLEFEAEQQGLPSPNISSWNWTGKDLILLTEWQFRELIPHGGELLYAKLEIWREALRTSYQLEPRVLSSHQPPTTTPIHTHYHQGVTTQASLTSQQPLFIHVQPQPTQQYQHHVPQVYQSPSSSSTFSPPSVMMSPHGPPALLHPPPSPSPRHPQSHNMPPSPSVQVPTPVIQAEQQQQQKRECPKSPPKKRPSPTPSASAGQSQSSQGLPQQIQNPFMEKCIDMTTLLQPKAETSEGHRSNVETSQEAPDSEDEANKASPSASGSRVTHIHLWQFLKELLMHPQLYGSCIRWLDRPKGVFKIEDSVRVARLWGKRKNRPAMNYDKLSRSIRQYYKKGIMKKTERSQRLVYQFCHPYGL